MKRVTILNPNKRDGGLFTAFKDEEQNIIVGDEVGLSCLEELSKLSTRENFQPQILPLLSPLNEYQVQLLQIKMSKNKAIQWDGLSDVFIRNTKNWRLLNDLWRENTR